MNMTTQQMEAMRLVLEQQRDKLLHEINQDLRNGDQESAMWRSLLVRVLEIGDKLVCAHANARAH